MNINGTVSVEITEDNMMTAKAHIETTSGARVLVCAAFLHGFAKAMKMTDEELLHATTAVLMGMFDDGEVVSESNSEVTVDDSVFQFIENVLQRRSDDDN